MDIRNYQKLIKEANINPLYDLTIKEMYEIYENYKNKPFELISCAFGIGYLKGTRAKIKKEVN